jgi:hypothetical protein
MYCILGCILGCTLGCAVLECADAFASLTKVIVLLWRTLDVSVSGL